MQYTIDINCDLGEGVGEADCEKDALLMPFLSRCNIACGGHAGNKLTMQLSLKNSKAHQVIAGAHPGYPDKEHFGRKSLTIKFSKLADSIRSQVDCLINIADQQSTPIHHIKLHGALYNDVEKNPDLAKAMADLLAKDYSQLIVIGLAQGQLCQAAENNQLKILNEGFIDRAYQQNKQLVARTEPGAVYSDIMQAIKQASSFAKGETIKSINNKALNIHVDTLCLHGDNKNAQTIAENLHQQLTRQGIQIQ